ncbi:AfsR/SARP family transcriptional regulator [Streptomyces rugosispiralis]|uniref:NB-ARC domain-containing protein n=1 Tax=Streptomyces rugosispiralis TaxID=2967341 RepID=A0ABT1UR29_9ACTN|nr:AfsR/SARP family transcriptional regulator [Streptomyces rugosispiralis]MCQ8187579.1 NB-ARC domain-containing protein [Streptomyces rugosispiralis]
MDFALLGPLVINVDGCQLTVPAARQRVLLAALLLNANRVVSADRLSHFLWDGSPPSSASATLRTYVMRLRQVLGHQANRRIVTRSPGYLIELDEYESDLGRFAAHRRAGESAIASGDLSTGAEELNRALSLWRDEPLLDIPSSTLCDVEVRHLQELRRQTVAKRIDVELELGRHHGMLPELWRLVLQNPLDEPMAARLMLALSRSGQPAEALQVFQRSRALLIDQLGTEPGPELRRMQQRVLRDDEPRPSTGHGQGVSAARPARNPPRPAQLPAAPTAFAGRADEAAALRSLMCSPASDPGSAVIVALTGGPGVGKSALALHLAHGVRGTFEDGQLFAELRDADGRPASPADVLGRFLADLGLRRSAVPHGLAERVSLYRSLIADRRMLVVLDDAHDAAQVRSLIPGSGGSRLIVTSRDHLADLEGAYTFTVSPLPEDASLELLGGVVGHQRVREEPYAARRIASVCAGLPLALRIAGVRCLAREQWSLDDMAERLTSSGRLLDELRVGDLTVGTGLRSQYAALRAHSAHSAHLGPPAGPAPDAAFRALGILDAADVTPDPVAVMLNCRVHQAQDTLERLVDARLLTSPRPGRYHLNDLVRALAREAAEAEATPVGCAVLGELLTWYGRACERIGPDSRHGTRLPLSRTGCPLPALDGAESAARWLARQRDSIVGAVLAGRRRGAGHTADQLVAALVDLRSAEGLVPGLEAVLDSVLSRVGARTGTTTCIFPESHFWRLHDPVSHP